MPKIAAQVKKKDLCIKMDPKLNSGVCVLCKTLVQQVDGINSCVKLEVKDIYLGRV